jgi:hypothetical protein
VGKGELSGRFTACGNMADGIANFNKRTGRLKENRDTLGIPVQFGSCSKLGLHRFERGSYSGSELRYQHIQDRSKFEIHIKSKILPRTHPERMEGGVEVQFHLFLTSTLDFLFYLFISN